MECAPKATPTNSITLIPALNADKAIKSKLLKAINHRGHGGTQRKAKSLCIRKTPCTSVLSVVQAFDLFPLGQCSFYQIHC